MGFEIVENSGNFALGIFGGFGSLRAGARRICGFMSFVSKSIVGRALESGLERVSGIGLEAGSGSGS